MFKARRRKVSGAMPISLGSFGRVGRRFQRLAPAFIQQQQQRALRCFLQWRSFSSSTSHSDEWTEHRIACLPPSFSAPNKSSPNESLSLLLPNTSAVFSPTPATVCTLHAINILNYTSNLWTNKTGIDWGTGKVPVCATTTKTYSCCTTLL